MVTYGVYLLSVTCTSIGETLGDVTNAILYMDITQTMPHVLVNHPFMFKINSEISLRWMAFYVIITCNIQKYNPIVICSI